MQSSAAYKIIKTRFSHNDVYCTAIDILICYNTKLFFFVLQTQNFYHAQKAYYVLNLGT